MFEVMPHVSPVAPIPLITYAIYYPQKCVTVSTRTLDSESGYLYLLLYSHRLGDALEDKYSPASALSKSMYYFCLDL